MPTASGIANMLCRPQAELLIQKIEMLFYNNIDNIFNIYQRR